MNTWKFSCGRGLQPAPSVSTPAPSRRVRDCLGISRRGQFGDRAEARGHMNAENAALQVSGELWLPRAAFPRPADFTHKSFLMKHIAPVMVASEQKIPALFPGAGGRRGRRCPPGRSGVFLTSEFSLVSLKPCVRLFRAKKRYKPLYPLDSQGG